MTTYADTFNKADSATVGATLTFTDTSGDLQNVSNRAEVITAGVVARSRAEHDTASVNQFAEIVVGIATPSTSSGFVGACLRYASGADTCYALHNVRGTAGTDSLSIVKIVAGSSTTLATATITVVNGDTLRFEVSGTLLTGYQNGVSQVSVTDASISTGTRGGVDIRAATSATRATTYIDNFTFGDLAVAASLAPENLLVRRNSLLRR